MKWIILLVFVFLLLLILIIPYNVKFGLHLNVIENKGYYCLKVAFIKILCGRVRVFNGKLEFENNNDLLFKKKSDENLLNKIFKLVLSRINLKSVYVFVEYGNKQNAANTALVCGSIDAIFSSLFSIIKSKYKKAYQFLDIDPNYNKDILETTVSIKFSISIIEVLISLVQAKIQVNSEEKNG